MRKFSFVNLVLLISALFIGGCERPVSMRLSLVEPCNQENQALSAMGSFELSVEGLDDDEKVQFTRAQKVTDLKVDGMGDAMVTVRAWLDDADASGPKVYSKDPEGIGRSMPMVVDEEQITDLDVSMMLGKVGSFARATNADAECSDMDNGQELAGRYGHSAVYMPSIQRVFIVGGLVRQGSTASLLRTAELFDPVSGETTQLDQMEIARGFHTATLLPDDRVLLTGGFGVVDGSPQPLVSATMVTFTGQGKEIEVGYEITHPMTHARAFHTATLFEEAGIVALIGGCGQVLGCDFQGGVYDEGGGGDPTAFAESIEVFRLDDEAFSAVSQGLQQGRAMHATTRFSKSQIVVTGGLDATGPVCALEVFKATGGTLERETAPGARFFSTCPFGHSQVALGADSQDRQRVAIIGGFSESADGYPAGSPSNAIQYWNTGEGLESAAHQMSNGRAFHAAALMDDGEIIVAGGELAQQAPVAEHLRLMDDDSGGYVATNVDTEPETARIWPSFTRLPNNQVMLAGGLDGDNSSSEVFLYLGD